MMKRMKKKLRISVWIACLLPGMTLSGCGEWKGPLQSLKTDLLMCMADWVDNRSSSEDPILVEVGLQPVRSSDYLTALDELPSSEKSRYMSEAKPEQFLQKIIGRKVWAISAQRFGVERTPQFRAMLRLAKDEALADAYRQVYAAKELAVSDGEIANYYTAHPAEFSPVTEIRCRRIAAQTAAEAARAQALLKTMPFEEVVRRVSIDDKTSRGHPLPPMMVGQPKTSIEKALLTMKIGAVSPVFKAAEGFLIFKKDGQINWPAKPLEWVRENIRKKLARQKESQLLTRLKTSIVVKMNKAALDAVRARVADFPVHVPADLPRDQ
jgi:hypothetical protein